MLAADKLLLQSSIRKNAVALKEKEFKLHNENFGSVGTQAAVLAGFALTCLVEIDIPENANAFTVFLYFVFVFITLTSELHCVAMTTMIAVCGTGLALRGPDGSIQKAVDGMYEERRQVFQSFAVGLFSILGAAMTAAIMLTDLPTAFICGTVIISCIYRLVSFSKRIMQRFAFEDSETTNIDDLLDFSSNLQLLKLMRQQRGLIVGDPELGDFEDTKNL